MKQIDDYGHGTEGAGVIANSTPSNVKISSYKVMDSKGYGSSSTIVAACSYIEELNNKPDIINFSLGLKTGVIIESVIDELVNQGITVVAAAGNDNREVFEAPGKCESAITVAAFDYYNKPCSFTNYGQVVDISAPGEYIYTADMSKKMLIPFLLAHPLLHHSYLRPPLMYLWKTENTHLSKLNRNSLTRQCHLRKVAVSIFMVLVWLIFQIS